MGHYRIIKRPIGLALLCLLGLACSFDTPPEEAAEYFGELEHRFATVDSVNQAGQSYKIRLVYTGNLYGKLLVFSHGSPGSWGDYKFYLRHAKLRKQALLVSYDRPGYGGTRKGQPALSLEEQVACLHSVVKYMQALQKQTGVLNSPVIVLGHSYGGPVVVRYAMDYPDQVQGMVVLAGALDPALEEWRWYNRLADSFLIRWMVPQDLEVSNRELYPLKEELTKIANRWPEIRTRVLILHGTEDSLVPIANVHYMQNRLKHLESQHRLQVEVREGMDHFFIWSEQHKVLDILLAWLQND